MIELLKKISAQGIVIEVEKGKLQLFSAKGDVDRTILSEIKAHKNELISYLTKHENLSLKKKAYEEIPKCKAAVSYSLSNAQKRLWLSSQIEKNSIAFNMPRNIVLEGSYDIACFKKAIHNVIARHEILRTVFNLNDSGEIRQYVLSAQDLGFEIEYKDYQGEVDPETASQNYIAADSYRAFDLVTGPLLRVALLQLSADKYICYYNMHHIISDGRSMEVLERDLMKYYEANLAGNPPDIPSLRIQYKDYAAWQLHQLSRPSSLADRDYWLKRLSGELTVIDLPSYKIRPTVKTSNGKYFSTYLSEDLTNQMDQFVKQHDGSLFLLMLSVINVLIYRYTAVEDIIIGAPIAGRTHPELEDQIGFYINALIVRNKIIPANNFIDFYQSVKEAVLEDYAHQGYPFDKLVEDLALKYDQSRSPLADISLTLHNKQDQLSSENVNPDLFSQVEDKGAALCKNDIEFHATQLGGVIALDIVFNIDVYDERMISNMMRHFKALMSSLLSNPKALLHNVDYLSQKERQELLENFNDTQVDLPKDKTILDVFSAQASQTPDAVALVFGEQSLSYRALEERSNKLANHLIGEYGLKKGDFVGVHLDRSEQYIVCLLGILKSGGVYVPIDVNYPEDRKIYILEDANIQLLITDTTYMFELDYYEGALLAINVEFDEADRLTNQISIQPQDLAYIIYTSGSTGNPKGVLIEHLGLLNSILAQIKGYNIGNNHRALQFTSFSFDISISEILNILLAGSSLFIANDDIRNDPNLLELYIQDNNIDLATLPPSYFHMIKQESLKKLKILITGGDFPDYEKVLSYLSYGGRYYNSYGPTETSMCVSIFELTEDFELNSTSIPIGKPIDNTELLILSSNLQLQPIGLIGELCIGGIQLAQGYLNLPTLTAEKFIAHPFKKGERLYRTGDLARWLPDGNIEFMGRKDHQVKIRGYRIELEEIESRLNQLDDVRQSVVIAKEDKNGSKQLIAYVVCEKEIPPAKIQELLEKKLPEYMVPKIYVNLEEMPLTPNDKIDRKALPALEEDIYSRDEYVAPSSEKEKLLVAIWESVLNIKGIGRKDNFYNLGGDSIKSIQIVSKARQHGYILKVGDVLTMPVLKDMASLLKKTNREIDQSEVEGEVILTPIQHVFFEHPSISLQHHFNQSVLLKSEIALDSSILKSTIMQLVKHHDVLRMSYQKEGIEWKQFNRKYSADCFRIDFHDLRQEEDSLATMGELGQALQAGFDLSKGPLFVVGHFRLSDGDRLALIAHHLLVDGVSWRILLEDIASLYLQHQSGEKVALPLKTDSFQRWAFLQQEYAHSKALKKECKYWERLHTEAIPRLATENANGAVAKSENKLSFSLDKELTTLMQTGVHEVYHTEINDLLLAALGLAIRDVFEVEKSVVEMEGHGREDIIDGVDITRTVGWFTTIYPLVLEVSSSADRTKSLRKVKDDLRKIPKKGIGYGTLKYLSKQLPATFTPSVQFNYLGDFGGKIKEEEPKSIFEYGTEYIGEPIHSQNISNTSISVAGMMASGELSMSVSYCSSLYATPKMQALIKAYEVHLTALIKELSFNAQSYLTLSDLSFPNLSYEALDILNKEDLLEDVYELSPAQAGMYYHWFSMEESYFEQVAYRIKGAGLNMDHFKQAYDALVDRYAILRTSFSSDYAGKLLQIVKKSVPSSFSYERFSEAPASDSLEGWVKERKALDRKKGFDLGESSQMRLKILCLGEDTYEFIWSHHHILMDGWCTSILINDFYRILRAIENGEQANLPAPKPYANYIQWLAEVDQEETLAYWKNYLAGYTSVANVPFVRSERSNLAYEFCDETIELTGEIYDKINNLCKELDVTHNTFIQVAWGYLLSRYNNTQDVVFGSVVSGRPADLEGSVDMVGLFLNTIPVRIQYQEKDQLIDLLKKTKAEAIASLPHHYVSLATVQGQSELSMALLDHIMIFENFPIQELIEEQLGEKSTQGASTLEMESVDVEGQTNYDFNIAVGLTETSLKVHFQFNKNKYEESQIKKLAIHFYKLVDSFTSQPNQYLKDLNYLTKEEEHELLDVFNPIQVDYPKDRTVVDLFVKQARETPEAIAAVFEEEVLRYKELEERSNQFAHYLHKQGVQREDLIGICMDKSLEMVVSILGVLKSGGTYIPIDPDNPSDRINYIIEDSKLSFLITDQAYECLQGNGLKARIILLDKNLSLLAKESIESPNYHFSPKQAVYIIYTSGSTGKPKGVIVSHASLLNIVLSWQKEYQLNSETSLLQMASFSFDVFSGDLYRSLLFGGKMILCPPSIRLDFVKLYPVMLKWKINILEITPAYATLLMDYIYENNLDVSWMKLLIVGSDICQVSDYERLLLRFGNDMRIINSYGTTETTIDSSYFETQNLDPYLNLPYVPIGKPLQNTSFYVLDAFQKPSPIGVMGELYIGGAGLANGYLNKENLTSEKFINHFFKAGERLYKTGDLARWLADGNLEFIGRKDHQIKIRGYRIELGEIEAVLDQVEAIKQSVVLAKADNNNIQQLVAYIVCEQPTAASEIQKEIAQKLPAYMVPNIFITLDEMPLTQHAKIDRKALPDPDLKAYRSKDYVAPTTETELKLIAIFQEILKIESIGIQDNFFDLGGNSLTALKIILRIRKELDLDLDIKSLFDLKVIGDLALQIDFSKKQEQLKSKGKIVKQIM
ncbi:MAG: amino acid adenylation domain-containing protein [Saprospiraceae bacterium]